MTTTRPPSDRPNVLAFEAAERLILDEWRSIVAHLAMRIAPWEEVAANFTAMTGQIQMHALITTGDQDDQTFLIVNDIDLTSLFQQVKDYTPLEGL